MHRSAITIASALAAVLAAACRPAPQPAAQPPGQTAEAVLPEPAIPFAPRTYVAYRAVQPLRVDGRLDEAAWQAAAWTEDFVDIEGSSRPAPRFRTRARMLWDSTNLYIAAELTEPDVWGTITERDAGRRATEGSRPTGERRRSRDAAPEDNQRRRTTSAAVPATQRRRTTSAGLAPEWRATPAWVRATAAAPPE